MKRRCLALSTERSSKETKELTRPRKQSAVPAAGKYLLFVMIGAGMFLGRILFIVLQNFMPMDLLFLIICVPVMALSLLLLITKVRETKDADLDSITADTYR